MRRTVATALITAATMMAVVIAAAAPAQAAAQYRWWGYWFTSPGSTSWTYASIGAGGHRVDDGGVEGWRFAVGVPNPSAPSPRTAASSAFQSICGHTSRPDGMDRVALVVDFGTSADAPSGEHPPTLSVRGTCVVVPDRSNGLTVLGKAGYSVRQDGSGLVCALQGYPRTECGTAVKATASPTSTPKPTSRPAPEPTAKPTRTAISATPPGSSDAGRPGVSGKPTSIQPAATAPTSTSPRPSLSGTSSPPAAAEAGATPSSAAVALEVGPPPDSSSGSSSGLLGLLVGVLAVAGLAGAAVLRARTNRGAP